MHVPRRSPLPRVSGSTPGASDATLDILLPFYGDPGYLRTAVESVLAQDDPRWTLTVIDDRYPGTEHTAYLESLDDPRVRHLVNETNLGVSRNFQHATDLATADYSVIFGGDDVMLPGYVSRVRQLIATHPGADVIQPGVQVIDEQGTPVLPLADRVKANYRPKGAGPQVLTGEPLASSLMRGLWTYFPSVVWKTSTLKRYGFTAQFEVSLDATLLLDIALGGGVLVADDEVVFQYRRHRASVSSATAVDGSRFAEERAFFADADRLCREKGWPRAARIARRHLSSRLNAVSQLPRAIAGGDGAGVRALLRHTVARTGAHVRIDA